MRIGLVIGTRPEAIKLAPVAAALARAGADPLCYLTGQHPGLDLADHGMGNCTTIPLGCVGRSDPFDHVDDVAAALVRCWAREAPSLVLVQGDTSSALGGARAADRAGLPLGHVEAGLRSFDSRQPWPEEDFRVEIDRLADLLFAPTGGSASNLQAENCPGEIHVTGQTGIDALLSLGVKRPRRQRLRSSDALRLLVTCHRRENWGDGLRSLSAALIDLGGKRQAIIDVLLHPNPRVAEEMWSLLSDRAGIRLIAPLGHRAMVEAMVRADLLLSDSGGVQEEAPALGVPLLILRDKTERPECIASGNARLIGTGTAAVIDAVTRLRDFPPELAAMAVPRFPFGDGKAAPLIAALSLAWLDKRGEGELSRTA